MITSALLELWLGQGVVQEQEEAYIPEQQSMQPAMV